MSKSVGMETNGPQGQLGGDAAAPLPEPSLSRPMSPDQVRELIQAEVDKQEPLEEARRAVALIAESSVRFTQEFGTPGFVIVGADAQPRTTIRDGEPVPFTIGELVAELRLNYPTLFKPQGPHALPATQAGDSAAAAPSRDWLMVGSGKSAAAARVQASLSAGLDSVRRGWRGTVGTMRRGKLNNSSPAPKPLADLPATADFKPRFAIPAMPIGVGFRPTYALYAGLVLVSGTVIAFLLSGRHPEAPPSRPPAQETTAASPRPPAATAAVAPPQPSTATPTSSSEPLRGVPEVVDTGTLRVEGKVVRLFGVDWARGAQADDLTRYLAGRQVVCTPFPNSDRYRCQVDGRDLSEVVLYNGGGKATPNATPELKAAEAQAHAAGLGVWQKP